MTSDPHEPVVFGVTPHTGDDHCPLCVGSCGGFPGEIDEEGT